jgi:putative two-component system hydrogenase maturation factor HypX/HoxX
VTVLEASGDVDGGDVWASRTFPTRETGKSSLYRHEVRCAAIDAILEAVTAVADGVRAPERVDYEDPRVTGRPRPLIRQPDRAIDWNADSSATVIRRVRAAEGHLGVLDTLAGIEFHLFGVHPEPALRGAPGEILVLKLPAVRALAVAGHALDVPEIPVQLHAAPSRRGRSARSPTRSTAASATCISTSTTAR